MQLDRRTIEALEHKASVAADEVANNGGGFDPEAEADWKECENQCRLAIAAGTVEVLKTLPDALGELKNYLDCLHKVDAEYRAIEDDLIRCGEYEELDPAVHWSKKPKTRVVDEKRWVVG